MMFLSLLLALAARQACAVRPEGQGQVLMAVSQKQQMRLRGEATHLRDLLQTLVEAQVLVEAGTEATQLLLSLVGAEKKADGILLQVKNATEHLDDEGQDHLKAAVELINTTIYESMDQAHETEQERLNLAAAQMDECNTLTSERLDEGGDIWNIERKARGIQGDYRSLQDEIRDLNGTNHSRWQDLFFFTKFLQKAPECPATYKEKTADAIGAFVASHDYKDRLERQRVWYKDMQGGFMEKLQAFRNASAELAAARHQLLLTNETLQIEYCTWHLILIAGCDHLDECYEQALAHFNEVVKRAKENQKTRKAAYVAGEIVISHIGYLLAHHEFPEEDPDVDTSRFELKFPSPPHKRKCDVERLLAHDWEDFLTDSCDHKAAEANGPGKQ